MGWHTLLLAITQWKKGWIPPRKNLTHTCICSAGTHAPAQNLKKGRKTVLPWDALIQSRKEKEKKRSDKRNDEMRPGIEPWERKLEVIRVCPQISRWGLNWRSIEASIFFLSQWNDSCRFQVKKKKIISEGENVISLESPMLFRADWKVQIVKEP